MSSGRWSGCGEFATRAGCVVRAVYSTWASGKYTDSPRATKVILTSDGPSLDSCRAWGENSASRFHGSALWVCHQQITDRQAPLKPTRYIRTGANNDVGSAGRQHATRVRILVPTIHGNPDSRDNLFHYIEADDRIHELGRGKHVAKSRVKHEEIARSEFRANLLCPLTPIAIRHVVEIRIEVHVSHGQMRWHRTAERTKRRVQRRVRFVKAAVRLRRFWNRDVHEFSCAGIHRPVPGAASVALISRYPDEQSIHGRGSNREAKLSLSPFFVSRWAMVVIPRGVGRL
jgi:hypothetical protein